MKFLEYLASAQQCDFRPLNEGNRVENIISRALYDIALNYDGFQGGYCKSKSRVETIGGKEYCVCKGRGHFDFMLYTVNETGDDILHVDDNEPQLWPESILQEALTYRVHLPPKKSRIVTDNHAKEYSTEPF